MGPFRLDNREMGMVFHILPFYLLIGNILTVTFMPPNKFSICHSLVYVKT